MKNSSRWKYLYCIISSKVEQNFGSIGVLGTDVYTIQYKDIAAVVSDSFEKNYEIIEHGIAHQKVVEALQKDLWLIPMAFGQVTTDDDVKNFLSKNYYKLKELLKKLEGKVELGLKIIWKKDAIMQEVFVSNAKVRALDKQVKTLDKQVSSKSKGRAYRLKVELGRIVANELEKRGNKIASEVYRGLKELSVDSRKNELLSDEMIFNGAFLVKKEKEVEFDGIVNRLEEKFGDKVNFKYVVSPPYNFVDLSIRSR